MSKRAIQSVVRRTPATSVTNGSNTRCGFDRTCFRSCHPIDLFLAFSSLSSVRRSARETDERPESRNERSGLPADRCAGRGWRPARERRRAQASRLPRGRRDSLLSTARTKAFSRDKQPADARAQTGSLIGVPVSRANGWDDAVRTATPKKKPPPVGRGEASESLELTGARISINRRRGAHAARASVRDPDAGSGGDARASLRASPWPDGRS